MVLVEANLVTTALMQVGKRLVPRRRPYAEFCEPTPRTNLCTVDATADVPEIPGVIAYGATQLKAFAKVRKLALEVIADRLDRGEDVFTGRKTKPAPLAPFRLEITPGRLALAR